MKKILLITAIVLSGIRSFSQSNNPFNKIGVDYVTSVTMIQNDYNSGSAKDFSEETLNYYSRKVPLKNQVSVEVASAIIRTKGTGRLDFSSFIHNTALSEQSKQAFSELIINSNGFTDAAFKAGVMAKVDQIKKSNIVAAEKEFVLSLMAISYNLVDLPVGSAMRSGQDGGCWISGPNGQGPGTQAQCIAAGAIVGGLIGYTICGILCGIGGAIIGGVVGALS